MATGGERCHGPWGERRGKRAKRVSGVGVPECPNVLASFPGLSRQGSPWLPRSLRALPVPPSPSLQVSELLGPGAGMLGLLGVSVTRAGPE